MYYFLIYGMAYLNKLLYYLPLRTAQERILMGRDTQLPDLMILFGTLGGLALFGMAGIIIGPVVAALFITMLEV